MRWLPGLSLLAFCCLVAASPLQAQGSAWEALIKGAEAALERKDFASAEEQLKAALEAAERFPAGDPRLGKTLNNLAAIYYAQGDYERAEPLLRRAVEAMEQALGPHDPDLAQSLKNLAALYYLEGDYVAAEPLLMRSLAIWERAVGSDHPYVATLLSNLAGLYQAQGRYNRAEPLLVRSLGIWETVLGPNHPDVAKSRQMLERLQTAMAGEPAARSTRTAETPPPPRPRPTTNAATESPVVATLRDQPEISAENQASQRGGSQSGADESGTDRPSQRHSAVIAFSRTAFDNNQAAGQAAGASPEPENREAEKPAQAARTAPQKAKAPAGGIALLLSSFRTREDAEGHWAQLQRSFPALLAHKELLVEEVTMAERGTFFRMLAMPFDDRTDAQTLCRTLKRQRQDCRVIQQ